MCGVTGFWDRRCVVDAVSILRNMSNAIAHRGPDDMGIWEDKSVGLGLAHRRLSIIDLSAAGHQPMMSGSGRHVIVFNGEIYNHLELRKDLPGLEWRGHSDTETLLALAMEALQASSAFSVAMSSTDRTSPSR